MADKKQEIQYEINNGVRGKKKSMFLQNLRKQSEQNKYNQISQLKLDNINENPQKYPESKIKSPLPPRNSNLKNILKKQTFSQINQDNIICNFESINKARKMKQVITEVQENIINILDPNDERYLLYMDSALAPKLRYRGRFPSPTERMKEKMAQDYDQITNKEHYRRRSCMCETCGLATNTIIQRLDEKAPPKLFTNQFFYEIAKKKKAKIQKQQRRESQINSLNLNTSSNLVNGIMSSKRGSKNKFNFLNKITSNSSRNMMNSSQFQGLRSGNRQNTLNVNNLMAQSLPYNNLQRAQRNSIQYLPIYQSTQQNHSRSVSPFPNSSRKGSRCNSKVMASSRQKQKKSGDIISDNESNAEMMESVSYVVSQSQQRSNINIEVQSCDESDSETASPDKKGVKQENGMFFNGLLNKLLIQKQNNNDQINQLAQIFTKNDKFVRDQNNGNQNIPKSACELNDGSQNEKQNKNNLYIKDSPRKQFKTFTNLISLEQYSKKKRKYNEEMGDQYYEILKLVGKENFEQIIQNHNDSDSDKEEQVNEKKKNNQMKIPKNKITKCFLDMYRFRPNNTVSNYVCSNNKKKSIINKLVPSLKKQKSSKDKDDSPLKFSPIRQKQKHVINISKQVSQETNNNKSNIKPKQISIKKKNITSLSNLNSGNNTQRGNNKSKEKLQQEQPKKQPSINNTIRVKYNSHSTLNIKQKRASQVYTSGNKRMSTEDLYKPVQIDSQKYLNEEQMKQISQNDHTQLHQQYYGNTINNEGGLQQSNPYFQGFYNSNNNNNNQLSPNPKIYPDQDQQVKTLQQLHKEFDYGEDFFLRKHKSTNDLQLHKQQQLQKLENSNQNINVNITESNSNQLNKQIPFSVQKHPKTLLVNHRYQNQTISTDIQPQQYQQSQKDFVMKNNLTSTSGFFSPKQMTKVADRNQLKTSQTHRYMNTYIKPQSQQNTRKKQKTLLQMREKHQTMNSSHFNNINKSQFKNQEDNRQNYYNLQAQQSNNMQNGNSNMYNNYLRLQSQPTSSEKYSASTSIKKSQYQNNFFKGHHRHIKSEVKLQDIKNYYQSNGMTNSKQQQQQQNSMNHSKQYYQKRNKNKSNY